MMKTSPTTIHGITFFDKPSLCISHYDQSPWIQKALSRIQSVGTFFLEFLNRLSRFLSRAEKQLTPYINFDVGNTSKRKLVVCLHGLNDNPAQFKKIIDEMQKTDLSGTGIYIPRILQKGNAKLSEMVTPIFQALQKWAKSNGDKELVLVGISNGARVERALDAEISKPENCGNIKKIRFISVVGACKGSSFVNLAHRLHLSWILSKNIAEEMPTDSKRIEQLNQDWSEGLKNSPEITRDFTFIASPHDLQVPNYDSTLMEAPNYTARYGIIRGHGHISIVNAASKAVASIILS